MSVEWVKEHRWPLGVFLTLFTVVVVNLAFAWVSMSDSMGAAGFEIVDGYQKQAK
jgi:hypothetical protein